MVVKLLCLPVDSRQQNLANKNTKKRPPDVWSYTTRWAPYLVLNEVMGPLELFLNVYKWITGTITPRSGMIAILIPGFLGPSCMPTFRQKPRQQSKLMTLLSASPWTAPWFSPENAASWTIGVCSYEVGHALGSPPWEIWNTFNFKRTPLFDLQGCKIPNM